MKLETEESHEERTWKVVHYIVQKKMPGPSLLFLDDAATPQSSNITQLT